MKNYLTFGLALSIGLCLSVNSTKAQTSPRYPRPGTPPPNGSGRMHQPPGPQHGTERLEKLESAKIAFITQRIDLSPREAEKFWPVYNQFQREMRGLLRERREEMKAGKDMPANERIDRQLDLEGQILELKKRYTREFGKVISADKIVRLFQAEKDFKAELIKELQERKERRN